MLAFGNRNRLRQPLGFAQVAIGLAGGEPELGGEPFDGMGQVGGVLQQRAGQIEPLGLAGLGDTPHMTYNIYST